MNPRATNPVDPYERFNRAIFKFNWRIDRVFIRPVAELYDIVIPGPIHTGLGNAWSNFYEPMRVANEVLQGELKDAVSDVARFMVNSSFGVFGMIDVGTGLGLHKHEQDLGLTFARWGIRESAYIVIPLLGSFTVRDAVAYPINSYLFSLWPFIEGESVRYSLFAAEKLHYRSLLLPADSVVRDAFDPYVLVRNAYLQKRTALIREIIEEHHSPEDHSQYEHIEEED